MKPKREEKRTYLHAVIFFPLMYVAVRTNMYNALTLDALEVIHLLRCKI